MSYIENTIAVLCGGAAGAVCRFKLNAAIMSGLTLAFPLGILCVNVLGGFLMGLLQGAMKRSGKPFTVGYSLLGTGFPGWRSSSAWDCAEVSPPSPPSRSIRLTSTIPAISCSQV